MIAPPPIRRDERAAIAWLARWCADDRAGPPSWRGLSGLGRVRFGLELVGGVFDFRARRITCVVGSRVVGQATVGRDGRVYLRSRLQRFARAAGDEGPVALSRLLERAVALACIAELFPAWREWSDPAPVVNTWHREPATA